jgi:intracellular septation protein
MSQPDQQPKHRQLSGGLKFILEFGPLIAFFAAYKFADIFTATAVIMVTTTVALAITWFITRKLSVMPIVTLVLIAVFGGLTLYLKDESFIKIKVTIINGLFAAILLGGWLFKKPLLKFVFGEALNLDPVGWMLMTRNWGLFFLAVAIANEIIWRNVSTDTWVTYKTFGILPLTFIFAFTQLPIMQKHMVEETKK